MAKAKRSVKKKEKKNVPVGLAHIQATFNNTIITFTDTRGNAVTHRFAAGLTAHAVLVVHNIKPPNSD